MKNTTSRRRFMRNSALAITGLAVLTPTLANAFTNSGCPFMGYNPYAELKSDLRLGIINFNSVTVKGIIYNKDGITPLNNGNIEVWHLSPNSSKYSHQGKLEINPDGGYEFITDFPNKEEGKYARIYFKVSTPEDFYFTELILNNLGPHITSAHWEKNNHLGDKLFPKKSGFLDHSIIHFNISI